MAAEDFLQNAEPTRIEDSEASFPWSWNGRIKPGDRLLALGPLPGRNYVGFRGGRGRNSGPRPSVPLAREPSRKSARIAPGKRQGADAAPRIYEHRRVATVADVSPRRMNEPRASRSKIVAV
jgi:hypothetical protein